MSNFSGLETKILHVVMVRAGTVGALHKISFTNVSGIY
jgi:hypothetical protein